MEQIWYDDIPGLFTETNYFLVLPMRDMSIQQKLNAIVRFFAYLGIFLALVRSDYRYLFLGIIAAILSIGINMFEQQKQDVAEKFLEKRELSIVDNKVCARSTVDNPFMNMSIADITLNPAHAQACDVENPRVKKTMDKNFNARLFRDVNDIFGNGASERQFYTMPVTTITNDQAAVGEWLYGGNGTSCKDKFDHKSGVKCWENIAGVEAGRGS